MKILCPQCEFSRDVPDDRLPSTAVIATCPRCKYRFRLSTTGLVTRIDSTQLSAHPAPNAEGTPAADGNSRHDRQHSSVDDALPPGAIIPQTEDDSPPKGYSTDRLSPPSGDPSGHTTGHGNQANHATERAQNSPHPESDFDAQQRLAREAYARQAAAATEQESMDSFALDNPWEKPQDGYPAAFYQTAMRVMFAAPRFFAGLEPTATQWRALLFYLVVGVIQIVVERLWGEVLSSALAPTVGADPQLQNLLQMLAPETSIAMTVLLRSAMITLELFFAAALYHLVFKLFTPEHANFSLVFQVLAYSSAPSLLCIVPVAGSIVGFIWGLACSFIGCRYALRLSMAQTVMSLVPLYVLGLPLIFYLLQGIQGSAG